MYLLTLSGSTSTLDLTKESRVLWLQKSNTTEKRRNCRSWKPRHFGSRMWSVHTQFPLLDWVQTAGNTCADPWADMSDQRRRIISLEIDSCDDVHIVNVFNKHHATVRARNKYDLLSWIVCTIMIQMPFHCFQLSLYLILCASIHS